MPWRCWALALEMVDVAQYDQPAYVRQLWDVCLRQARCRLAASAPAPPCPARPSSVTARTQASPRARRAAACPPRLYEPAGGRCMSAAGNQGAVNGDSVMVAQLTPTLRGTTPAGVSTVGAQGWDERRGAPRPDARRALWVRCAPPAR